MKKRKLDLNHADKFISKEGDFDLYDPKTGEYLIKSTATLKKEKKELEKQNKYHR